MYFKYRRMSAGSHTASLKLTQQGVLVALIEDGQIRKDLFFEFTSVVFVEALKFSQVRGSSDKKPKAMFIPVDEAKPPLPDKCAFQLDKTFHYLTSSNHPPLVVCVVRRPSGVKALDCHVFALDTVENSLHIAALIGSTQLPATPGDTNRKGSFDRKSRNDIIRTEFGEYNVYRGNTGHESIVNSGQVGYFSGPGAGDIRSNQRSQSMVNDTSSPIIHGGMLLTQEDFHRPQLLTQNDFHQRPQSAISQSKSPYSPESIGGFRYDPPTDMQRPDILRQMSGEEPNGSDFMRHQETSRHSNYEKRHSNSHRFSSGNIPPPVAAKPTTPRSLDLSPTARYPTTSSQLSPRSPDVVQPPSHVMSARSSVVSMSPRSSIVSPSGFNPGEIFSASNLESRGEADIPEESEDDYNGRPVAKVPPHMKGVKVLPSDFRAVKLKPKLNRNSESFDDYDSNKDMLISKFRDPQERDRVLVSEHRSEYHDLRNGPTTDNYGYGEGLSNTVYQQTNNNNNKVLQGNDFNSNRRYNYEDGRPTSQSFDTNSAHGHTAKDAEIASMFSDFNDFKIHGGGRGNPIHRQQRNDFEQGLGYLP